MKVFVCWSGDTSRRFAESLKIWLPNVLQNVEPYFTPEDVKTGVRWFEEVSVALEQCRAGILCLTPSNLDAKWLHFEAGALAKSVSQAKVCPLLFNVRKADVEGPLAQFQAAEFDKAGMRKLVGSLNEIIEGGGLDEARLDVTFGKWWPDLEREVRRLLADAGEIPVTPPRPERGILEEILDRVRAPVVTHTREFPYTVVSRLTEDMADGYLRLARIVKSGSATLDDLEAFRLLGRAVNYFGEMSDPKPSNWSKFKLEYVKLGIIQTEVAAAAVRDQDAAEDPGRQE